MDRGRTVAEVDPVGGPGAGQEAAMGARTALRRVLPGRNPLARRGDRVEGAAVLVSAVVALLGVPVAAATGSALHAEQTAVSRAQAAARHQTAAVLIADSPSTTGLGGEAVVVRSDVPARWTAPDGSPREGLVRADADLPAGTAVPVWLDREGNPVPAPLSPEGAVTVAVAVAVGAWALLCFSLVVACALLRVACGRVNARRWEQEWAAVEASWRRRA